MSKIQISYETEEEKTKLIKALSAGSIIKHISKPYKSGKYHRIYLKVE